MNDEEFFALAKRVEEFLKTYGKSQVPDIVDIELVLRALVALGWNL
jgi:hypothetical protein